MNKILEAILAYMKGIRPSRMGQRVEKKKGNEHQENSISNFATCHGATEPTDEVPVNQSMRPLQRGEVL